MYDTAIFLLKLNSHSTEEEYNSLAAARGFARVRWKYVIKIFKNISTYN